MNEQETTTDIIAEMRGGPIPQHRHDRELLRHYADRLKAAHKRERGNAAKLREAASYLTSIFDCDIQFLERHAKELIDTGAYGGGIIEHILNSIRLAKEALAAPPRNCDVGTAEEQEKRFHDFCRARHLPRMEDSSYCAYKCPLEGDTCCGLQWAQMPYTEGDGR